MVGGGEGEPQRGLSSRHLRQPPRPVTARSMPEVEPIACGGPHGCRLRPRSVAEGALHERDCLHRVARRAHLRRGGWMYGTRARLDRGTGRATGRHSGSQPSCLINDDLWRVQGSIEGDRRTSGTAIIWLDGYYSGRVGLTDFPAGWLRTVSQGIGGTCAISANEHRTVLDVIGQLHRDYAGQK